LTTTAPISRLPLSVPNRAATAQILYDGHCPLCLKSVEILKRLDWLQQLSYVNVRDPAQIPRCDPPLDPNRLLEEMHLLTPDGRRIYHGFPALRRMAWRLPLLWPLLPLLYLPGMAALGQRTYLWVARNRFHLVPCHGGVCTIPQKTHLPRSPGTFAT
jgi:predicted DCC family thiol-disulfide oxidoreductase YuxK